MTHDCPIRGCPKKLPPEMLMCKRHWFMVRKPLRDEIWRHWRKMTRDWSEIDTYNKLRQQAIDAVNKALNPL